MICLRFPVTFLQQMSRQLCEHCRLMGSHAWLLPAHCSESFWIFEEGSGAFTIPYGTVKCAAGAIGNPQGDHCVNQQNCQASLIINTQYFSLHRSMQQLYLPDMSTSEFNQLLSLETSGDKWCSSRVGVVSGAVYIFVSDMDRGIECTLRKSDDDRKMSGAIDTLEGRDVIQKDYCIQV
ncbi:hypothetical protein BTVI_130428 [Pitangus sulphuratus]|nr:hypothetical protein BTVI_130428 [Pitangus sulphuratus]